MVMDDDVVCQEHSASVHTFPPTNTSCWADCFQVRFTACDPHPPLPSNLDLLDLSQNLKISLDSSLTAHVVAQAEWTGASPFTGALVRPNGPLAVTAFDHVDTARRGNATVNRTPHPRLKYRQSVFLTASFFITCTAGLTAVSDPRSVAALGVRTNLEQRLLR